MINKILFTLGLADLNWLFYYIGGEGHKWVRLVGGVFCMLITMFVWGQLKEHWLSLLICSPLLAIMLNQYWDKLTRLWRGDENEYWENWVLHGLGIGLAMLPFTIATGYWIGLIAYTATLAFTMMAWSEWQSKVFWEAGGRGALIIGLLPLLLI